MQPATAEMPDATTGGERAEPEERVKPEEEEEEEDNNNGLRLVNVLHASRERLAQLEERLGRLHDSMQREKKIPEEGENSLHRHSRGVYLAGPHVFREREDALRHFARAKAFLATLGLRGIAPFDVEIAQSLGEEEDEGAEGDSAGPIGRKPLFVRIFEKDEALILRSAGTAAVLADLTPFRSSLAADTGTCVEVGLAVSGGKPVFGFSGDSREYKQRVMDDRGGHDASAEDWFPHVEDFGQAENLMVCGACERSLEDVRRFRRRPEAEQLKARELFAAHLRDDNEKTADYNGSELRADDVSDAQLHFSVEHEETEADLLRAVAVPADAVDTLGSGEDMHDTQWKRSVAIGDRNWNAFCRAALRVRDYFCEQELMVQRAA